MILMFTIYWTQNGNACSFRTHNRKEAVEVALASDEYYSDTRYTFTDTAI